MKDIKLHYASLKRIRNSLNDIENIIVADMNFEKDQLKKALTLFRLFDSPNILLLYN